MTDLQLYIYFIQCVHVYKVDLHYYVFDCGDQIMTPVW